MIGHLGNRRRSFRNDFLVWLSAHALLPHRYRGLLLRLAGHDVDATVHMRSGVRIVGNHAVTMKAHVFVNEGAYLDASAPIFIDRHVQIANHVRVITGTHEIDPAGDRVAGPLTTASVHIQTGAWIGSGATVLPGVTVGSHAVLGAGAVATSDLEPYGVYVGVPARLARTLEKPE